jgi:hypothetical protein
MPKSSKKRTHDLAGQEVSKLTGAQMRSALHLSRVAQNQARIEARKELDVSAQIELSIPIHTSPNIGMDCLAAASSTIASVPIGMVCSTIPHMNINSGLNRAFDVIQNEALEENLVITRSKLASYSLPAPTSMKSRKKPHNTELVFNACWGHSLLQNHNLSMAAEDLVKSLTEERISEHRWNWPFLDSQMMYHNDFTNCDTTKYGKDIKWNDLDVNSILASQVQLSNVVIDAFMALVSDYQWKELRSRMSTSKRQVRNTQ